MDIAQKLKLVRKHSALTLDAVSERTGIATSAISEFENARREPKLVQLQKLATVYRRTVAFFLDEGMSPTECVLWRERPESPDAESIEADLVDLAQKFHSLEVLCDEHSPYELPLARGTAEEFSYPKAESLAYQVRNKLGLGDRPGQTLLRVLEEVCNIKVFHLDFAPTGSAACSVSDDFGAAVLLNSGSVRWRRNFDLAHELFHLLTWSVFRHDSDKPTEVASAQEERFATCFARNLLMPAEAFKEAISVQSRGSDKLGFDGLFEVAREFDVSVEAVMWHMSFVYNLDCDSVKASIERAKSSLSHLDTRESDEPPVRPTRYVALCNQAFRKGLIATGRYAECLGISRRKAMKHLGQDAIEDVQVEFAHS